MKATNPPVVEISAQHLKILASKHIINQFYDNDEDGILSVGDSFSYVGSNVARNQFLERDVKASDLQNEEAIEAMLHNISKYTFDVFGRFSKDKGTWVSYIVYKRTDSGAWTSEGSKRVRLPETTWVKGFVGGDNGSNLEHFDKEEFYKLLRNPEKETLAADGTYSLEYCPNSTEKRAFESALSSISRVENIDHSMIEAWKSSAAHYVTSYGLQQLTGCTLEEEKW